MARSFVEIASFSSRLEAEAVGHALDPHGIPFLIRSDDVGIFGPGMTGWNPTGARLLVPEDLREKAESLLECVVRPATDETSGNDEAP